MGSLPRTEGWFWDGTDCNRYRSYILVTVCIILEFFPFTG